MTTATYAKLGDIAQYLRGINFKPDDVTAVGTAGTFACMRTKNIQESLDCSDVWGIPENFVRRPEQILREGDMLVSSANSWNLVGKCCWIPKLPWKATFGGFVSAVRADPKQVNPRFLYWWFSSDRTQALLRSFGRKTTSISNLSAEQCLNLDVPLPPLPEQRRIAAILDQADALRAKRRDALAQLDSLTQSIFIEMFGDPVENPRNFPVKRLIDIIDPARPITYGILMPGENIDDGVKYVRVVDMKKGGIELSGVRKTTPEISHTFRRSVLKPGDLLMSIRGHVGRLAMVPAELNGANITQDTVRLAVTDASAVYIREYLRSLGIQRWMVRHTKGVAVRGINLGDLKSMPITLPPQRQQDEFSERANTIEKLTLAQRKFLTELDTLFASLQHRAFRGEL